MHNGNFPKIIHIEAFELTISQSLSDFDVLHTCEVEGLFCIPPGECPANTSCETRLSEATFPEVSLDHCSGERAGGGEGLQHKDHSRSVLI